MSYSCEAPHLLSSPTRAPRFAPLVPFAAGLLLAPLAGCSAPVVDEDEAAEATEASTQAILLVDRSDWLQPEAGLAHSNVSAKFIRLPASADRASVERVLGAELDLPALGDCTELSPPDPAPADFAAAGPIELLDVGDVTLRMGDQTMPLAARAFPDLGGFVSGVFYTSRDAERDLPSSLTYVLEASGSSAQGRLSVPAEAPGSPDLVTVEGVPLESGLALGEARALRLGWRASGSPSDLVYVDLAPAPSSSATGASRGPGLRCAFRDGGEAEIPGEVLAQVASGAQPAEVLISLHRVRQLAFSTPEVEHGEIRFDLSVAARLVVGEVDDASRAP